MPAGAAVGEAVAARVGVGVDPPLGEGPIANKFTQMETEVATTTNRRNDGIIRLTCKAWRRVQLQNCDIVFCGGSNSISAGCGLMLRAYRTNI